VAQPESIAIIALPEREESQLPTQD
jgi:hypothetical protein